MFSFEIQCPGRNQNNQKHITAVVLRLHVWLGREKTSLQTQCRRRCTYSMVWFWAAGETKTGWCTGVTECHQRAPGNKWCKKASEQTPHCLSIALHATQPAQYLLRHLQSNLGWQAQMAPLIQVNYLWTFQSKQTCRSPEGWALIGEKRGGERRHAYARARELWQYERRPCLCQNMIVRTTFFFMWKSLASTSEGKKNPSILNPLLANAQLHKG